MTKPVPPKAAEVEGESLGFLLATASRLLSARFESALSAADLNIASSEARTLAIAQRLGAVRQSTLASALRIEPMTLVGHLDRLEARGLATRVADPDDRRSKLVCLTDAARPQIKQIRRVLDQAHREVLHDFSADELADFRAYLERLARTLGADATRS